MIFGVTSEICCVATVFELDWRRAYAEKGKRWNAATIKVQIPAIPEDVLTASDSRGAELSSVILSRQLLLVQALLF